MHPVNSLIVGEEIRTLRGMSRAKVHCERDRASHGMSEFTQSERRRRERWISHAGYTDLSLHEEEA
ncbi:hypothetical protein ccbrp13_60330 [Ktedonobacteria bacterium brp13]|nr:hypothetical protein ccbrp13_60330 [Ktedonobacteria bacterium brp13]